jgi:hypothetical protein
MAIVAIMLVPHPFPLHYFVRQFVNIGSFGHCGMGIDGEPDKDSSANDCTPDKKIPGSLLIHETLLFSHTPKVIMKVTI